MKNALHKRLVMALALVASCFGLQVGADDVTKARFGSLRRDDLVVVDVKPAVSTNDIVGIITNYDNSVIRPRETMQGYLRTNDVHDIVAAYDSAVISKREADYLRTGDVPEWAKAEHPPAETEPAFTSWLAGFNWSQFMLAADVPEWAKAETKPSYGVDEIGGLGTALVSKQGRISVSGLLVGDGNGGVSAATKEDITALGIPDHADSYPVATQSSNGLMSASDKVKLDGIPALGDAATKNVGTNSGTVAAGDHTHPQYLRVGDVQEWAKAGGPPVASVNGKTGDVTLAVGDISGAASRDYVSSAISEYGRSADQRMSDMEQVYQALSTKTDNMYELIATNSEASASMFDYLLEYATNNYRAAYRANERAYELERWRYEIGDQLLLAGEPAVSLKRSAYFTSSNAQLVDTVGAVVGGRLSDVESVYQALVTKTDNMYELIATNSAASAVMFDYLLDYATNNYRAAYRANERAYELEKWRYGVDSRILLSDGGLMLTNHTVTLNAQTNIVLGDVYVQGVGGFDGVTVDGAATVSAALALKADASEMSVTNAAGDPGKVIIQLQDGKSATVAAGDHTHSQYLGVNDVHDWAKAESKPGYSVSEISGLSEALGEKQATISVSGLLVGDGSGGVAVAGKSDITALGIPAQDTTYSEATHGSAGLMSAADKEKLDGVAAGAAAVDPDLAASGAAADAKTVGDAFRNGFSEWRCIEITDGWTFVGCTWDALGQYWSAECYKTPGYPHYYSPHHGDVVEASATWSDQNAVGLTIDVTPSDYNLSRLVLSRVFARPTKTSQLANDSGFLTQHQDISGKADRTELGYSLSVLDLVDSWSFVGLPVDITDVSVYYDPESGYWGCSYDDNGYPGSAYPVDGDGTETEIVFTTPDDASFTAVHGFTYNLCDRAVNAVHVTNATMITLPFLVTGKSRDFYLKMAVTGSQQISFSPGSGITYTGYGNPAKTYAAGTYLLRFTETSSDVFHVVNCLAATGSYNDLTDMPLSGKTYDFATNEGLYLAVRDIVEALGGSVTNFPTISQ